MNAWWFTPAPTNATSSNGTATSSASCRVVFWIEWQRPTTRRCGVPEYVAQHSIAIGFV